LKAHPAAAGCAKAFCVCASGTRLVTIENIGNANALVGNRFFAGAGDCNGDGTDEILWCNGVSVAYSEANKENFKNLTFIA